MTVYEKLVKIQKDYPELTFKNNGYEYLSKEVQERNAEIIKTISDILKDSIAGFVKFNNFVPNKGDETNFRVRCQYNWGADEPQRQGSYFIGVGYFPIQDFKEDGR